MAKLFFPVIDNGGGISQTAWGMSMFALGLSGFMRGHEVVAQGLSYPYPDGALNVATADFLETDCDRMVIIDTDESFEPRHVQMLLSHDVPFVAGLYCKKQPGFTLVFEPIGETNPFSSDPNEGDPLVEVARVARGFLSVHRSVFELIAPSVPEYLDAQTGRMQRQFWRTLPGGHSEDFEFCDRYRSLGGRVLVDKRVVVYHHGNIRFPIPGTY